MNDALYQRIFGPPILPRPAAHTLTIDVPAPPLGAPVPDRICVTAYVRGVRVWDAITTPDYYAAHSVRPACTTTRRTRRRSHSPRSREAG